MNRIFTFVLALCTLVKAPDASAQLCNSAVRVDGINNDLAIGCPVIEAPYTLELWYCHDPDLPFKESEVFFPGLKLASADYLPLVLKNGVLSSPARGLEVPGSDLPGWHHAALVCDGTGTRLYFDGVAAEETGRAMAVLPTGINYADGVNADELFRGDLDEVRIWKAALDGRTIRKWMFRDIEPSHPEFDRLFAYYNFDDGLEEMCVNPMGTGHQAYHIRNGKIDAYAENGQAAYVVRNNNPLVRPYPESRQKLFNAVVVESEWDARQGSHDEQILKLRIRTRGNGKPLMLKSMKIEQKGSYVPDSIRIWDAGCRPDCKIPRLLAVASTSSGRIRLPEGLSLRPGINYILVTADIPSDAPLGYSVRMGVKSFRLGLFSHKPITTEETLSKRIIPANGDKMLGVLQWNIWHAGRHLGETGPDRVAELIKACRAEIVTMQEGYGSQEYIANRLGMNCQTCASNANLALLSLYPVEKIETSRTFNSNPGIVTLPDGHKVLVNDLWLMYAWKHCYTENPIDQGQNVEDWIAEDKELGEKDLRHILENDTKPYIGNIDDIILSGDFNSCSHLDWTDPSLHYGYGPVGFPISRLALAEGFIDCFREANPDERLRPEGTWAVIYGHLQNCRIDFTYHKGSSLRTVSSKIIRTAPQIDDVWPSDHAAVFTIFEKIRQK